MPIVEIGMRITNSQPAYGSLFSVATTLVSPMHEAITNKPLYNAVAPRETPSPVWSLIAGITSTFDGWRQRRAQRIQLGQLNDRMLEDVGLARHQVEEELKKPFWR
ncbi:MAG: DUF1127 domain-containing protein [Geminicoccaceae bacterium]